MDKTFLRLYNEELQYIREMSGEFAAEYPKIAGRLALDREGKEVCADPFVERLLEGFAFLTARVRRKFDAEFPRFTQSLLETVYPHYLSPTPSMLVAQMVPDLTDGALSTGFKVPRGTILRSRLGRNERTACEYTTGHDVTLWPLTITEAQYYTRDLGTLSLPADCRGRSAMRIRLEITAGAHADMLKTIPHLDFYIRGSDDIPTRIFEQMIGRQSGGVVRLVETGRVPTVRRLSSPTTLRLGHLENEALLPHSPRTFEGYRLLKEYMAFPQRFLFTRVQGIGQALAGSKVTAFDVVLLFNNVEPLLEGRIDKGSLDLGCTPAINLVKRRADRIALDNRTHEHQIITDRTRPLDFEVYRVESVNGIGAKSEQLQTFFPFYGSRAGGTAGGSFYTTHRVPRTLSQQEKRYGKNTSYTGSELYLSLVDGQSAPYSSDLRQLALEVLVTNRHLPLSMGDRIEFTPDGGGPVQSVRCVTGPTPPQPSHIDGEILWRLISHLSLNYLSVDGGPGSEDPGPFRELLRLYADVADRALMKQIDGVQAVTVKPVVRRIETLGPVTFVRGSEITLRLDETAFEGAGVFLFGSIVERFLTRYASINSFTETVIVTPQRGEVMRWPIQTGTRPLL
ncbi:MAG: type VI secretion system baseplate subunit TssF [Opitutaceae bacterium]|nr:type VI secretion system baseplate subunit TssF [Opitutaceae bacterium]